ncbi:MAG: NAD-dependent epimerase/dehydratase family protein, partial [Alphaproteobacteria bacterium]
MTARRVLITGAGGYVGKAVVAALSGSDWQAVPTARQTGQVAGVDILPADLGREDDVRGLLATVAPTAVIHCAARIRGPAQDLLRNNIEATSLLARLSAESGVARLIHCSTTTIYGGNGPFIEASPIAPAEPYGWSKLASEAAVQAVAGTMQVVILRLSGVHGPERRNGLVSACLNAVEQETQPYISEPETILRVLFREDAAQACCLSLDLPMPAGDRVRTYNIAGADGLSLRELAGRIGAAFGKAWHIPADTHAERRNRDVRIDAAR